MLSWVSWPRKVKLCFYFWMCRQQVFFLFFLFVEWFVTTVVISLCYFCFVAHQENIRGRLSLFIIVFPLLPYTHDPQQHGCDEGGTERITLVSMLSTSRDIWCTGKAHGYLEREVGHCLSVASLTAFSHNNWSAFVNALLILMRSNPLFSPQWIHR